jgi:queuine/archaeosine tRNA-ribosyltransferase
MKPEDIDLNGISGLFVGGSVKWKWRTAKTWCDYAHENKIKCHIGRVGTIKDYIKAESCGADSVDGLGPSRNNRMDIPIKFLEIISKEQRRII